MSSVLGFDIGGANLKLAHSNGTARTVPYELWKHPHGLTSALRELAAAAPPFDLVAVTMTGELCDCFASKREGVQTILDAVAVACSGSTTRVYRNDGQFVDLATAYSTPYQVAAANWLALTSYAGRFANSGLALLIDVGSTTTDIIPLLDGKPVPQGRTDAERLRSGELVYRGVRRTPICAVARAAGVSVAQGKSEAPTCEEKHRLAAEFFATVQDAFLVLGAISEDPDDHGTADGRSATKAFAHARLARMLGEDGDTCSPAATAALARTAIDCSLRDILNGLQQVAERFHTAAQTFITSGSGEFFAKEVAAASGYLPYALSISLSDRLGPGLASAACAYAVAILAAELDDG